MNELQVKTINLEPAKVEFNHDEIAKELDSNLAKYENLTFTEENTSEIRKVLAELRKGKRAVDRYRIDTKKELINPVTEFEDKCKELTAKFDGVINPLNEQLQDYVQRQRKEKRNKLLEVRKELIEKHELNQEYHDQVEILDVFLNASTSMREATDSIEFKIENLKMEQEKKKADKQVIETSVKLANAENDLSLSAEAYVRLLEFNEVENVQEQIKNDASKEVEEREKAIERKRIAEEKKAEQELIEKEKAEKEQAKQEKTEQEFDDSMKEVEQVVANAEPPKLDDLPFGNIDDEKEITESYVVTATKEEHERLKKVLTEHGFDWRNAF